MGMTNHGRRDSRAVGLGGLWGGRGSCRTVFTNRRRIRRLWTTTALRGTDARLFRFGCSPHPGPLPGVPGRGRNVAETPQKTHCWASQQWHPKQPLIRDARPQPPAAQITHCWTSQQWHPRQSYDSLHSHRLSSNLDHPEGRPQVPVRNSAPTSGAPGKPQG